MRGGLTGILGALMMLLVLAACGDAPLTAGDTGVTSTVDPAPTTTSFLDREDFVTSTTRVPPTVPTETIAPPQPSIPPGVDPLANPQVEFAVDDLATRLEVDPTAIEVIIWEEVVWNDGSIGCPQPGMLYTQALVDGVRIVLFSEGRTYDYHAAGTGDPFLCEKTLETSDG